MEATFQRASVIVQAGDFLRSRLRHGEWPEQLPGERPLCDLLQVSRSTLRAALLALKREGLIHVSAGRWRRTRPPSRRRGGNAASKVVGLLCPVPQHCLSPLNALLFGELRRHLEDAGYHLQVHSDTHYYRRFTPELLSRAVRQIPAAVWVLHWATPKTQQWFAQRETPTLVLGSNHEGVRLSSIDFDYRASCRHAVGVFLGRGHRRIGLVIRHPGMAGDLESERGFREGIQTGGHPDASPAVFHHSESISTAVESLLRYKPRPTALLVSHPSDFLMLMTSLTTAGLRVPQDMSLISRDDETFLDYVKPSIARYRCNLLMYARRLAREVMQLAVTPSREPRQIRIAANFQSGDSLGSPPS